MKRKLITGLILALSLVTMISCKSTNDSSTDEIIETPSTDEIISEDKKGNIDIIELNDELELPLINVSAVAVDVEYENNLSKYYTIDVLYADDSRGEIKVDAITGEVLSAISIGSDDATFDDNIKNTSFSLTDIKDLALKAIGGVGNLNSMELLTDDGVIYYNANISNGNTSYTVQIDATSGNVLSYEENSTN